MLFGIAALSALTATIAAFLVREREHENVQLVDIMRKLESLQDEIRRLTLDDVDPPSKAP